jgi:gluconolactonase
MEITRRSVLAAAAATGFDRTAVGDDWIPHRYPDDTIKVLDPSFAKYKPAIVGVERLATGMS